MVGGSGGGDVAIFIDSIESRSSSIRSKIIEMGELDSVGVEATIRILKIIEIDESFH